MKRYSLDLAHYYTFTWDAMLKHTRVNFELLIDIDMMFIERGIRCDSVNAQVDMRELITRHANIRSIETIVVSYVF